MKRAQYRNSSLQGLQVEPAALVAGHRLMRDVLPAREKYSPNVGTWRARSGNPDRILHMWAYRDLVERDGLRPAINADPAWQQYVSAVTPLIADMESILLAPIPLEKE